MPKILALDPDKCTGCGRCEMVCSLHHYNSVSPALSAIQVVRDNKGTLDSPVYCIQCGICMDACPEGALERPKD